MDAEVSVWIIDQDPACLETAISQLSLDHDLWQASEVTPVGMRLYGIELICRADHVSSDAPTIVIESIAERLDVKRSFFSEAEVLFGKDAILCSNTSTLRISTIAETLARQAQFCGMHFFMPVDQRPAVEVIAGEQTSEATLQLCARHARRIGREPLVVGDGPGFVVNRLLSPYLNEAMLLLGRGVSAEQIERAALSYGMPMSPLELIDWIGTRTMFDAGRVFWQSFPGRMDTSPILPALIKRKRPGRAGNRGLFDYCDGVRSKDLANETKELCEKYQRDVASLSDHQVILLLAVPMWIEAALAFRDGIARSTDQLDLAMRGGLGFRRESWLGFFDDTGSETMLSAIEAWSSRSASMRAPVALREALGEVCPSEALTRFACGHR